MYVSDIYLTHIKFKYIHKQIAHKLLRNDMLLKSI